MGPRGVAPAVTPGSGPPGGRAHARRAGTPALPASRWFLPFVTEAAHRAWGLPPERFDPPALLAHVWSLVAPGGALLLNCQGEREAGRQRELLARAGLRFQDLGVPAAALSPFEHPRPAFLAIRE